MIYAEHVLICITVPLLIALVFIRGDANRFVAAVIAGICVCLLAAYISGFIDEISGFGGERTAVFISPAVEETMKLLPILLYLFLLSPDDNHLLLVAVGVGTGFAIFENCCYLAVPQMQSFAFVAIRGFAVGVMHVISAVALALGLALVRRFQSLTLPGIVGSLSLSTTFHGLYNLAVSHSGISAYIGYSMPLLTAMAAYYVYRKIK